MNCDDRCAFGCRVNHCGSLNLSDFELSRLSVLWSVRGPDAWQCRLQKSLFATNSERRSPCIGEVRLRLVWPRQTDSQAGHGQAPLLCRASSRMKGGFHPPSISVAETYSLSLGREKIIYRRPHAPKMRSKTVQKAGWHRSLRELGNLSLLLFTAAFLATIRAVVAFVSCPFAFRRKQPARRGARD